MSMTTNVVGIIPPDETYNRMKKVYNACIEAEIDVPEDVQAFFDYSSPNPDGTEIELKKCYSVFGDEFRSGILVDVTKLPKNVKKILFYNSW